MDHFECMLFLEIALAFRSLSNNRKQKCRQFDLFLRDKNFKNLKLLKEVNQLFLIRC